MFPSASVATFRRRPGTKRYLLLDWPGEVANVSRVHRTRGLGSTTPPATVIHGLPAGSPGLRRSKHPLRLLSLSPAPSGSEGPPPSLRVTTQHPLLYVLTCGRPSQGHVTVHLPALSCSFQCPARTSPKGSSILRPWADRTRPTAQACDFQLLRSGTLQDASSPPQAARQSEVPWEEDTTPSREHKAGNGPPPPSSTYLQCRSTVLRGLGMPADAVPSSEVRESKRWLCHADTLGAPSRDEGGCQLPHAPQDQ
ncbi:hypothetical protein NDU88_004222 [Pleurodeles waltl]|uniref:Uncharacterized protein n=1 Tax=Pleurodeles waltl TaxID=8319 RepID=A0AAV7W9R2_PLEWA|nr:hypothetical protein NDU88_004222 [Pleurodeles waltl]